MTWTRLILLLAAGGTGFWYMQPQEAAPERVIDSGKVKNRQAMIRHYERLKEDMHERARRSNVSKADAEKYAEYQKKIAELRAEISH